MAARMASAAVSPDHTGRAALDVSARHRLRLARGLILPPEAGPTPRSRGALIVGFAVVFGLWLVSGFEMVRSLRRVEERVTVTRIAFERGEGVLTTVRTSVLLGSVYLRDALLDPSPATLADYRDKIDQIRAEVEQALPGYLPLVATPAERDQWARLQAELTQYWESREVVLAQGAQPMPSKAAVVLRDQIVPARESILEIVDALSALQRASQERQRIEASLLYRDAEIRIVSLAAMAIFVGLVVALVVARRVGGLEQEIEWQRTAEGQNRQDLERLSAKLVHAQEEERRTLARELHDAVGQALTAIKMEMGVALRGVDMDSRARQALEAARAIAESTLQNVRDLSQLLHPSTLDDFGLPEALGAYLRSFSTRSGIRAQLSHARMSDRLPPEIEVCVYRIVQEALTNIARHSGASSCTVALFQRHGSLHLTIEDDGRGIDAATARAADARRGLGLIGMRERAQALAGSFVVENRREGGGTRVAVRMPAVITAGTSGSSRQLAG